ncbi:glycoside hydrolase family 113 [Pontibacter sp. G13]|uniref:glycoside hydrolase family 113 n=1 Tax=Pontibacter sp. G13 TaxID=3074898 RepID=UPI00288C57A4|nr:hypothetical protein [Pontibacter sp. G13]WNJ19815.1 hypothetical protein RJD25_04970 [Pontibacter sp. G13]
MNPSSRHLPFVACWLLFAMLLLGCPAPRGMVQQSASIQQAKALPTRNDLVGRLRQDRTLTLVYGTGDPEAAAFYAGLKDSLDGISRYLTYRLQPDTAYLDSPLPGMVVAVGTPEHNPVLQQIMDALPIEMDSNRLSAFGQAITGDELVLNMGLYPHPIQRGSGFAMVAGNTEQAVRSYMEHLLGQPNRRLINSNWGMVMLSNNERLVMANYGADWEPDPQQVWTFLPEDSPSRQLDGITIRLHGLEMDSTDRIQLMDRLVARRDEIFDYLHRPDLKSEATLHLYGSAEEMGLRAGQMLHSFLDKSETEAHQIWHPAYSGNDPEPLNQLWVQAAMGPAATPALAQGMALMFSPKWQKEGALYWAARLVHSGDVLTLDQLTDRTYFRHESDLVAGAFSAALVDFLLVEWGQDTLLERYAHWTYQSSDSLESKWQTYLQLLASTYPVLDTGPRPLQAWLKGMTFAHEGYSVYDGYGSKQAAGMIDRIRSLSANSMALVPYSGSRQVNQPGRFHFNRSAGGENDASLVVAAYHAQTQGMSTLLKPQLWFPGHWPGDVEMQNEADWQAFMGYYRQWIRHYALLAEIHGIAYLCVGVEFAKATQARPEDWRKLCQDMRKLFSGPITYAANWGEEAENLAFGEALDFIGVNAYYPLSEDPKASDQALKAGVVDMMTKIQGLADRTEKPIVFTEVGFRSIEAPWQHPHAGPSDRDVNETDQARCYATVLAGIQSYEWLQGAYWWKWPSYPNYDKRNPKSFTPCGRKAQQVLARAYQHMP